MDLVSADTNVFIWMIRKKSAADSADAVFKAKRHRARLLLAELAREIRGEHVEVVMTSMVAAELMMGMPKDARSRFLAEATERFRCISFDARAAEVAAGIATERGVVGNSYDNRREALRADIAVVATAAAAGVSRFYSHDEGCRKLAKLVIKDVRDLPEFAEDWIDDLDARK
jgi:predicted nucleic acid-binding protein